MDTIIFVQNETGPPPRRRKAPRIPPKVWQRHRNELHRMYMEEGCTVEDLKEHMKQYDEFQLVTKRQFNWQFNKWNWKKNVEREGPPPGPGPRLPHYLDFSEDEFEDTDFRSDLTLDPTDDAPMSDAPLLSAHPDVVGASPLAARDNPRDASYASEMSRIMAEISFGVSGEWMFTSNPIFIRRTADVGLFFLKLQCPQISQMAVDKLQQMIYDRPGDSCSLEMQVAPLLRLLQRQTMASSRSKHLQNLGCQTLLSICTYCNNNYALSNRGRMFFELVTWALRYCGGDRVDIHDLSAPSHARRNVTDHSGLTFIDRMHHNCQQVIGASQNDTSEADWSHMLLGLSQPSQDVWRAQINTVASFIRPDHIDKVSEILSWCVSVLNNKGYLHTRRQIVESCCLTLSRDIDDVELVRKVERHILFYHLISSFWRLRSNLGLDTTSLDSAAINIFTSFQDLLNDFGMSEFDILERMVDTFVGQCTSPVTVDIALCQRPCYLEPAALKRIAGTFVSSRHSDPRIVLARWWLKSWIWREQEQTVPEFQDNTITTILVNHILGLLLRNIEHTHMFSTAKWRDSRALRRRPTLPPLPEDSRYEENSGYHQTSPADFGLDRVQSPNPMSNQNRWSTGTGDLAVFQRSNSGRKARSAVSVTPSMASGDLPSAGITDLPSLRESLRLSGSSTSSGSVRSRISAFVSATFSLGRASTWSSEDQENQAENSAGTRRNQVA